MDPKTSLKPAYSEGKFSVEQLSSEDFHRKLYEFFEDRGLVTDLRSHLRTKMINVLKETPIGRSDCKRSMSPKMQAINLLLAEFLIQQNCFYSLSVFSTEVPLANILPELTNNFVRKPEAGWKFEEKDASDILETLGFDATILNSYFDQQNTESLLCCILKALPRNFKPTTAFIENHENIEEILKASHLPPSTIEQITQEITQIKDDIIKEQKEVYEKLIEKHPKIALTQTKNDYDEKTIEEYKQIWQNKNDALKLKEKQLQEKEKQLQEKERELQKRTTEFNDIQTKNEDELVMLKRKIEELREENIRLENMNGQQRRNTEKLKLNARLLSSELSAARTQRRMRVNNNSQVNKAVSLSGEGEQGKKKLVGRNESENN